MSITLDGIVLPIDLVWSDELNWSPVVQKQANSLTGSLIVQEAKKLKGRTITLSGAADSAWITRSVLDDLKLKSDVPNLVMTLSYYGTDYFVMFNRSGNKSPVESRQIVDTVNPDVDHRYSVTLTLMEV